MAISGISGSADISSYGTSNVSSGSIQFMFALLQMELAQYNKELALDEIKEIKAAQEESKEITEVITLLRNSKTGVDSGDEIDTSGDYADEKVKQMCEKYNITYNTSDVTTTDVDAMIASLEGYQEEASSGIQQKMVFVQDYMGQYNSYTQGSSSAISDANETLKTVARG